MGVGCCKASLVTPNVVKVRQFPFGLGLSRQVVSAEAGACAVSDTHACATVTDIGAATTLVVACYGVYL